MRPNNTTPGELLYGSLNYNWYYEMLILETLFFIDCIGNKI